MALANFTTPEFFFFFGFFSFLTGDTEFVEIVIYETL